MYIPKLDMKYKRPNKSKLPVLQKEGFSGTS